MNYSFSDQKASRLTAKEWCNQNSLSIRTYNYWKYALKEELANQLLPNSVPIAIPETSVSLASIISNDSALTNCAIRSTSKPTCNNISIEFDYDIQPSLKRSTISTSSQADFPTCLTAIYF